MSAPGTNLDTQTKRHIGPLMGMGLAAGFVLLLLVGYLFVLTERGTPPVGVDVQIDGRTGTVIEH